MKNLKDTVEEMLSDDYVNRFKSEYWQTKIRYEALRKFNTRIEASTRTTFAEKKVDMPKHDCPEDILREQQSVMGNYLRLLEVRAEIEGIEL